MSALGVAERAIARRQTATASISWPFQVSWYTMAQPNLPMSSDLERLVAVQRFVHRAQGVLPAAHAAQCHRQPLQELGSTKLITDRMERKRVLEVPDGVVERGCVEGPRRRDRQVTHQTRPSADRPARDRW